MGERGGPDGEAETFRQDFVFALDPNIPGNYYIDMEGNVHKEPPAMEPPPVAAEPAAGNSRSRL